MVDLEAAKPQRAPLSCSGLSKRLTLRFPEWHVERAFLAQRRQILLHRSKTLTMLAILALVVEILIIFVMMPQHVAMRATYETAQRLSMVALGIGMLFLVLLRSPLATRMPVVGLEVLIVALSLFSIVLAVMSTPSRLGKVMGFYSKVRGSDSTILLAIDTVVTALHLGLPVRWFLMVPMQLASVLLYVLVALLIGSKEESINILMNVLLLSLLVLAASMGKRSLELDERACFLEVIEHKTLRCAAEYELSRQSPPERTRRSSEVLSQSTPASAESAVSGAVFDPLFEKDGDVPSQLARVAQLAESERWRIEEADVELIPGSELGAGGFGVVSTAVFCGMIVAVKSPREGLAGVDLQAVPELCNEIRVLRHLRHPNIVTTHGAIIIPEQPQVMLVLELIDGVELQKFVLQNVLAFSKEDQLRTRCELMIGLSRALLYMHSRRPKVVHGDLKGGNVMVERTSRGFVPKLLDFGLSRVLTRHSQPMGWTLLWVAPEVLRDRGRAPRTSADIYSFGRVLAFTATSVPPFPNMTRNQIRRALLEGQGVQPTWPAHNSFEPLLGPLVELCVQQQVEERPDIFTVHNQLLDLPEELELSGLHGSFLQNMRIVAAHRPRPPRKPASLPEESEEPQQPESMRSGRLPALPEEDQAGSEADEQP